MPQLVRLLDREWDLDYLCREWLEEWAHAYASRTLLNIDEIQSKHSTDWEDQYAGLVKDFVSARFSLLNPEGVEKFSTDTLGLTCYSGILSADYRTPREMISCFRSVLIIYRDCPESFRDNKASYP
jgi:hypothetical protein